MEIREFSRQILFSETIAAKLTPVVSPISDAAPGAAERVSVPARSAELKFCGRHQSPPMPHPEALADPKRRAVAHHIMANHELQALEVMAFVLLAFPDAPSEFREGMLKVMADEQRHTRLHIERLTELGLSFGELPVNGYFWRKAQQFQSVLEYLAGLPLTFEGCNLDHTLELEEWFERAGDRKSAGVMRVIHRDEIGHVAFGLHWLRALKPSGQTDWEAYASHLHWPLRPDKSRGKQFHREPRVAAGMSPEFIDRLEVCGEPESPGDG